MYLLLTCRWLIPTAGDGRMLQKGHVTLECRRFDVQCYASNQSSSVRTVSRAYRLKLATSVYVVHLRDADHNMHGSIAAKHAIYNSGASIAMGRPVLQWQMLSVSDSAESSTSGTPTHGTVLMSRYVGMICCPSSAAHLIWSSGKRCGQRSFWSCGAAENRFGPPR